MGAIVSDTEVNDYFSSPVVQDTYDDDNNGTVDTTALAQVITLAEAKFLATVRGLYELPLVAPIDPYAKLITLQIIHCLAIKRFPERFRNGLKVCEEVDKDLKALREGETQLAHPMRSDAGSPEAWSETPRGYNALEPSGDDDC